MSGTKIYDGDQPDADFVEMEVNGDEIRLTHYIRGALHVSFSIGTHVARSLAIVIIATTE